MQKKNNSSQLVTTTVLKKELKAELSKLATKKDLEMAERSLRVEIKLSQLRTAQRIEDELRKTKDLLLTTFDPLLAELEQRREDRK